MSAVSRNFARVTPTDIISRAHLEANARFPDGYFLVIHTRCNGPTYRGGAYDPIDGYVRIDAVYDDGLRPVYVALDDIGSVEIEP